MVTSFGVPRSALRSTHMTRSHSRTMRVSQEFLVEPGTFTILLVAHSFNSGSALSSNAAAAEVGALLAAALTATVAFALAGA
jgi:hypothetical protein